jgi:hypothetical protein
LKTSRAAAAALAIVAVCASSRPAAGQAWAPREGEGDVTFVTQMIDHVGRVAGDIRFECCGTTNVALVVDADYGVTDRWSMSFGLPYVFAKYRGEAPAGPAAFLPYPAVDSCHCVHGTLQDFHFGTHYNLIRVRRSFSVMTSAELGAPTHHYDYAGEAVVGFGLTELALGADAGAQLDTVAPGLSVDAHYGFTIVERVLGIGHNRGNARLHAGYTFPNRLGGHVILSGQRTYGGLRFPDDIRPFPERWTEFHRLLRDNYFQVGAGASYTWRDWDLSLYFLRTVSGTNTHDVHVYTASVGRAFRLRR